MLHTRDMVYTKFCGFPTASNDRLAVIGNEGILFSMSHLNEAFLVSSHIKGPSAVSLETLDFSSGHLENDFSIRLFYHEAQTGTQYTIMSKEIVHEASYDRKPDGTLTRSGDIIVDARPRVIQCSPSTASVHVRSSYIDMGVQESEKAYVKRGLKRVHVSRSGMVVSDGNCITSMDHFGRIVSST
ncbi:hypothetical protein OSTOST_09084 [Ostertagia ostertagi]